jgi:pimeloyl-ACP methyl ester carboxylesterase
VTALPHMPGRPAPPRVPRSRAARRRLRALLAPAPLRREAALGRMERIAAITHVVASLEYLSRPQDRRPGGFNHWAVTRGSLHARSPRLGRAADAVADPRVTAALHVLRVPVALSLLAPLPRRWRAAADAGLAASSAALYPRHHYGTDGSDQVAFLVHAVAAVARVGARRPQVVDACLWSVALQSTLSYGVSGWVKLAGPSWRNGDALAGVTRTLTYGDRRTWALLSRFPRTARALGTSVVALECCFPAVFAARGRLAPALLLAASGFHLANARVMGLGRFVWAFGAMHPAVHYATGPREKADADGRILERRDDTLPRVTALLLAAGFTAALLAQARRRATVLEGRGDERVLVSTAGNRLAYRRTGDGSRERPVVVVENGLVSTPEHWEWIVQALRDRFDVVTYYRAGYGPSVRGARSPYGLEESVGDLAELIAHVGGGTSVVVLGHSLGGYLALRAAAAAGSRVRGLALLDSSHPAELERSARQAQGKELFSSSLDFMPWSLQLGLGALLKRPEWVDALPAAVRRRALAEYRDARLWRAGQREWRATVAAFEASEGRLPEIGVPVLVLTAGCTASRDPEQWALHQEIADAAPRAEQHVIEGADHDQVLTDADAAGRVAALVGAFAAGLEQEIQEVLEHAHAAR